MRQYEFAIRIAQIHHLVEERKFKKALAVIRTLDMKKVKNVSDLTIIADVFAKTEQFDSAREAYLKIYNESKTRRIVQKLIIISIRTKKLGDAERYYQEFIKMKPGTVDAIILRYRIDKAAGVHIGKLVETLEELKEEEYIEEWAYELAKLYYKAGRFEECRKECEDILLWFGHGEIVERAKKLIEYVDDKEAMPYIDDRDYTVDRNEPNPDDTGSLPDLHEYLRNMKQEEENRKKHLKERKAREQEDSDRENTQYKKLTETAATKELAENQQDNGNTGKNNKNTSNQEDFIDDYEENDFEIDAGFGKLAQKLTGFLHIGGKKEKKKDTEDIDGSSEEPVNEDGYIVENSGKENLDIKIRINKDLYNRTIEESGKLEKESIENRQEEINTSNTDNTESNITVNEHKDNQKTTEQVYFNTGGGTGITQDLSREISAIYEAEHGHKKEQLKKQPVKPVVVPAPAGSRRPLKRDAAKVIERMTRAVKSDENKNLPSAGVEKTVEKVLKTEGNNFTGKENITTQAENTATERQAITTEAENTAAKEKTFIEEQTITTEIENTVIQTQDITTQAENTAIQTQDTATQTENTAIQTQNIDTQAENTAVQTQNIATQAENTAIQTQNITTEAENTVTQTQNIATQAENTTAQAQVITTEVEDITGQINNMATEIEKSVVKEPEKNIIEENIIKQNSSFIIPHFPEMEDGSILVSKEEIDLAEMEAKKAHEEALIKAEEARAIVEEARRKAEEAARMLAEIEKKHAAAGKAILQDNIKDKEIQDKVITTEMLKEETTGEEIIRKDIPEENIKGTDTTEIQEQEETVTENILAEDIPANIKEDIPAELTEDGTEFEEEYEDDYEEDIPDNTVSEEGLSDDDLPTTRALHTSFNDILTLIGGEPDPSHFVFVGNKFDLITGLSKKIVRVMKDTGYMSAGRIARISAKNLNKMNLAEFKNQLKGNCLLIDEAAELMIPTIAGIFDIMDEYYGDFVVILADNGNTLDQLFKFAPALAKRFKYIIDISGYTEEDCK